MADQTLTVKTQEKMLSDYLGPRLDGPTNGFWMDVHVES